MRVNNFNPYGCINCEQTSKQSQHQPDDTTAHISKNIMKNEAVIAALLAAIDRDQREKNKKKKYSIRLLNKKKQARLLLSSLCHIKFGLFRYAHHSDDGSDKEKKEFFICCTKNCKRSFNISNSAAKAIMNAAEAWVLARNKELSETASLLFFAKENEKK